ncbi:hypothetical protein GGR55DRAFT_658050 [Xylaria sp. FL0064]|nr:hypothetical protein GGR55DRAFT_658050 [Xylaria sp. FL0064]
MEEQLQDAISINTYEPRRTTNSVFDYFSKLPPEIRCIIWGLTIPCRLINPYRARCFSDRYRPPIIAQVCHESREVARRTGSFVVWSSPPGRYWFDSRYDVIVVQHTEDIMLSPRSVETIVFPEIFLPNLLSGKVHTDLVSLPKLKFILSERETTILVPDAWKAWADRHLQATGNMLILDIDIDNQHEVNSLTNILLSRPEWYKLSQNWLEDISCLRKEKFRLPGTHEEQDWQVAREQLQEGWLRSYRKNIASAESSSNEQPLRAKIPEFRRVHKLTTWYHGHAIPQ